MRLQNIYDSIEPAIMRKVECVISRHEKEYRWEILAENSPMHGLMKKFYGAYTSNAADRIMSTPLVNEESTEDTITIRRPYQYTELSKLYSEEDIEEWLARRQRLAAAWGGTI